MIKKEALSALRELLRQIVVRRSKRASLDHVHAVRGETELFLVLFSVVDENFLKDNDLGTIVRNSGVAVSTLRNRIWQARDWFSLYNKKALANDISEREYTSYTKYADIILMSIEQTILDIEKQDKQQPSWLLKAAAAVAFTIGGYTMPVHALEVEAKPANVSNEKNETKKDYVAELEAKVKEVKIEEGKDWNFYNETANSMVIKKDYVSAIRNSKESVDLNNQRYSPKSILSTSFYNLALSATHAEEKSAYLREAVNWQLAALDTFEQFDSKRLKGKISDVHRAGIYSGLGALYEASNDKNNAIKFYELAVKTNPSHKNAVDALIRLRR